MADDLDETISGTFEEREQKPAKNWAVWMVVLIALILGYGVFFSSNTVTDFAYLFGYNLPLTLILFFSFRGLMGKDNKENITDKTLPLVLLIFVSLMIASQLGANRNHEEAKVAVQGIKESYNAVWADGFDKDGHSKVSNMNLDVTPKARGNMGVAEQFVKTYLNGFVTIQNDYLKKIDDMGWNRVLDGNRLKGDPTLQESRKMIADAHFLVAVHRNKFILYAESGRDQIKALNVDQDFKGSMLAGFEKGIAESTRRVNQTWDYEAKIVSEVEVIINLLASRKGHWGVQERMLMFSSQSDLDEFNASNARIQSFTKEQRALRDQSVDAFNKVFSSIK